MALGRKQIKMEKTPTQKHPLRWSISVGTRASPFADHSRTGRFQGGDGYAKNSRVSLDVASTDDNDGDLRSGFLLVALCLPPSSPLSFS